MSTEAADRVFELAAELFALLSVPARMRIVCVLCDGERGTGELSARIGIGAPAVSRHLGALCRGGVLARRRAGTKVLYRVVSEKARLICATVCDDKAAPAPGAGR